MNSTPTFSDCELDTQLYILRRAGQPVRVRPKVFEVLCYLIEHRDRVLSKDELCEAVWPKQFISDSTLVSTMRAVRRTIGDSERPRADSNRLQLWLSVCCPSYRNGR
ncbi:hypothetical protein C2W62_30815 [Candidatus Entotheonella serta]|nr:hypothetical protein C2W62_30815 [Candidatus Entotheonella serta]